MADIITESCKTGLLYEPHLIVPEHTLHKNHAPAIFKEPLNER
jgi:hypothetical protein